MSEAEGNGPVKNAVDGDVKVESADKVKLEGEEESGKANEEPTKGKEQSVAAEEPLNNDKEENLNETVKNEATDLESKIIRQIEYYFGDINLPRDKFLREQTKADDGWVPLETMLKFKRLASLTTDPDAIITALTKSPNNLMEVNEDRSKIRRAPDRPLPEFNEARRNELMTRTVYAKGFPKTGVTLDDLLAYFADFGLVENVQMRSYLDKAAKKSVFKGSVFIIFKTKELAEQFLARESVKFQETELIRKWQSVYFEDKKKERKERDEKRKSQRNAGKNDVQNAPSKPQHNLSKGAIMKLKGFSGEVTREDIKKELTDMKAEVAFIDFDKGDSEGWVRLHGENSAQPVLDQLKEKPLVVCGCTIEAELVDGEEEEGLLEKTREALDKIRDRKSNRGRRGRGRGGRSRGGFHGDRKRKGGTHEDEPPAKVEAVAAE
ncbi:la protein homolog [Bacillus rossius redtenbacheri]|uniref:la protein homolog n=1 Tax=Bacillus rossius redtenbacheri TaxID=93214 RepID=UPI002FDD0F19